MVKQANKAANGLDFSRSELEGNECLLANCAVKSYIYISNIESHTQCCIGWDLYCTRLPIHPCLILLKV